MGPRIWLQMQQSAHFAQAKMRYGIPFSAGSTHDRDHRLRCDGGEGKKMVRDAVHGEPVSPRFTGYAG